MKKTPIMAVEDYLDDNEGNPDFTADFVKMLALITVPVSMLLAFATRFNPEFQGMSYVEVKIGLGVGASFWVMLQIAKIVDKKALKGKGTPR